MLYIESPDTTTDTAPVPHALIVDDDEAFTGATADFLRGEGLSVATAGDLAQAREALAGWTPDIVLVDLMLPDGSGLDLVPGLDQKPRVIVITGHPSVETAIGAIRERVDDYLVKPVDPAELRSCVTRALADGQAEESAASPARWQCDDAETAQFGLLFGVSDAMNEVFDAIEKVAPTDATVLLQGESGTGKELVAQAIHEASGRRGRFLALNCGAIAENLIGSELFGHEKGSFTGATRRHHGYFERASGGTLFLDEITEMPVDLQVNLLRVLETNRIVRIGGDEEVRIDARLIAATNSEPRQAVVHGRLREDLYFRLNVFPMRLPSLRERPQDIPLLAQRFLDELNERHATSKSFTDAALSRLRSHKWPGNVRELRHVIQRVHILAGDVIDEDAFPEALDDLPLWGRDSLNLTVGTSISEAERRLIFATLEHFKGDKKLTAETLGVSLKTVYNRLKDYGEEEAQERSAPP